MTRKTLLGSLALFCSIVCLRLFLVGCTCDPIYHDDTGVDGEGMLDGREPDQPTAAPGDGAAGPDVPTASGPYGPCPCPAQSTCLTSGCETCAPSCFSLADCPQPPDGTAVPECLPQGGGPDGICVLLCGASTCPTGMECDFSFSPMPACMVKCSK